jgi:UDP-glucose 4-epimerase
LKIVVIGGAGFIGKHLVRNILSNSSHKLIIIDNLSNSNLHEFYDFIFANGKVRNRAAERIAFKRVDTRNKDDVQRVFQKEGKVGACIHLAARVSVNDSLIDPESTFATNVKGTENILSPASQVGTESLVFASSAAVYGVPRQLPVAEEDTTEPISPYGKSKLLGEALVNEYASKFRFATSLRIFNAYGKGQTIRYGGVVSRFADRILNDLPPVIYGDGYQTRDFISIDDVIRAIITAARIDKKDNDVGNNSHEYDEKSLKSCKIFNIGTGIPTKILDLAEIMKDVIRGSNHHHHLRPIFESLPALQVTGDIPNIYADTRKSGLKLGFNFKDDLRTGLVRMFSGSKLNLPE